jgi:hypothetical protein
MEMASTTLMTFRSCSAPLLSDEADVVNGSRYLDGKTVTAPLATADLDRSCSTSLLVFALSTDVSHHRHAERVPRILD